MPRWKANCAIVSGIDGAAEPVWTGEIEVSAPHLLTARHLILGVMLNRIEFDDRIDPQRRIYDIWKVEDR